MKKLGLTILKTIVFFLTWALVLSLFDISIASPALSRLWLEALPLFIILFLSFLFLFFIEKRRFKVIVFFKFFRNLILGLLLGVFWLGSVAVLEYVLGVFDLGNANTVSQLPVWILAASLNVIMQELLVRGYLYQLWKYNYSRFWAIAVTTTLFVLMHGGALEAGIIPALNVVTMSLFVSALLEYSGSLVAPILVHLIWNVVGALVLGGVSLAGDYPQLFTAAFSGSQLLSGGVYGFEASIITLTINTLLFVLFLVLFMRDKKAS
ncbi:MAG: CPBP family intramembrane metalloprotease [Erysipelotrichaceae bacterium]|jgi:membrane protease YdiL (CAAX protease family)|nr:CPBP family intramembrane metalloprotease [Erysipelotrichaceae bacterium]